MPSRKAAVVSRQKRQSVKRLLDGVVIPKISAAAAAATSTPVIIDLATDGSQSQSSNDVVTSSSSMLKKHEQAVATVKKGHATSPDPTLPSRASSTTLQVPGGQQAAGAEEVRRIFILSIALIRSCVCDCCRRIGNQSVQKLNFSIRQSTGDTLV